MPKPRTRKATTIAMLALTAVVAATALAGCYPSYADNYRGMPEGKVDRESAERDGLQAFWLNSGQKLAITIWGSSSCPAIVSGLEVVEGSDSGNTVRATVPDTPPDRPCTMDYVPHTTVFWTPNTVTTTKPLTLQVGEREVELPIK